MALAKVILASWTDFHSDKTGDKHVYWPVVSYKQLDSREDDTESLPQRY